MFVEIEALWLTLHSYFALTIAFDTRLIHWNISQSFWSWRPLLPLESKIQNKASFYRILHFITFLLIYSLWGFPWKQRAYEFFSGGLLRRFEVTLSLDPSKKNRAVPAVCVIVALGLMNDQVSLQRKGITVNLLRPCYRVESSRQSMKDFWEQCFYSLSFVATSILNVININQESFAELKFSPTNAVFFSYLDSCRYKLNLQKFIAFVRQLFGRSLVNLDENKYFSIGFNTVLSFQKVLLNGTVFDICTALYSIKFIWVREQYL